MGLASEADYTELEQMCTRFPEVRAARDRFEGQLEQQIRESAQTPPAGLKDAIAAQLSFAEHQPAPVVPMTPPAKRNSWKYVAAAAMLLLFGSLYWNISLFNRNEALVQDTSQLKQDLDAAQQDLAEVQRDASVLQNNPHIKMAALEGTNYAPGSFATVYWDTTSKDVYLLVNNLPQPASDKQYQLWAILDGKPVDMGMLTVTEKPLQLYKMKNAQDAQAFAITLEEKGGSPTPKGEMYAMGKL